MFLFSRHTIINTAIIGALLSMITPVNAQDDARAERLFRRCAACHTLDEGGPNRVGPNLFGVFDRGVATLDNYRYSKAMLAIGGTWTDEKINQYLLSPRTFARGTKMAFAGIRKTEDRQLLIEWLKEKTAATDYGQE